MLAGFVGFHTKVSLAARFVGLDSEGFVFAGFVGCDSEFLFAAGFIIIALAIFIPFEAKSPTCSFTFAMLDPFAIDYANRHIWNGDFLLMGFFSGNRPA